MGLKEHLVHRLTSPFDITLEKEQTNMGVVQPDWVVIVESQLFKSLPVPMPDLFRLIWSLAGHSASARKQRSHFTPEIFADGPMV
ncbi:hypothetical protein ACE41H_00510 [Paenibacillus enshidis]|uniref:Uncharacterized protein n=1 Tax=Paenibacillus enshidis TaxID=1458439 RepID=A0ABV5APY6_9BACL